MNQAPVKKTSKAGDQLAITLAMAFGIGRAKVAPGTFGSLPGLLVGAAIHGIAVPLRENLNPPWLYPACVVLLLTVATLIAYWAIARTERVLGIHDDQRIVIDEVVGQAIAVAFAPLNWLWYVAAFALFRLFDITKPGPIGWLDRDAPGALGTLGDDVLAGIVAALLLGAALYFLPPGVLPLG